MTRATLYYAQTHPDFTECSHWQGTWQSSHSSLFSLYTCGKCSPDGAKVLPVVLRGSGITVSPVNKSLSRKNARMTEGSIWNADKNGGVQVSAGSCSSYQIPSGKVLHPRLPSHSYSPPPSVATSHLTPVQQNSLRGPE